MSETRNNYRAVSLKDDPTCFRVEYRPFWSPFWFSTHEYAMGLDRAHMKAELHAAKSVKHRIMTVYLGRKP